MKFIKPFRAITSADLPLVGGKTASLGQMMHAVSGADILIPDGFAITADAYWHFVNHNRLMPHIEQLMGSIHDYNDLEVLKSVGHEIRSLFIHAVMSVDLADEIRTA